MASFLDIKLDAQELARLGDFLLDKAIKTVPSAVQEAQQRAGSEKVRQPMSGGRRTMFGRKKPRTMMAAGPRLARWIERRLYRKFVNFLDNR
jgi:hypothetical protein